MRRAEKGVHRAGVLIALLAISSVLALTLLLSRGPNYDWMAIAGCVINLALCVPLLRMLRTNPFPIAFAMTAMVTLEWLLAIQDGESGNWSLIQVLLLLSVTIQAHRLRSLARKYPDLYVARRMRGEHLRHAKRGADRTRRWIAIACGVAVVVAGGAFALVQFNQTDDPAPVLARFHTAWNRANVIDLGTFGQDGSEDKLAATFANAMASFHWNLELPAASAVRVRTERGTDVDAELVTEAGAIPFRFSWDGKRWVLTSIRFTAVKDWRP